MLLQLHAPAPARGAGSTAESIWTGAARGRGRLAERRPRVLRVAAYIYFLAAVFTVSSSILVAQFVQIALGTLAIWFIASIARDCGEPGAWVAGTLAALTGYFTFNEMLTTSRRSIPS